MVNGVEHRWIGSRVLRALSCRTPVKLADAVTSRTTRANHVILRPTTRYKNSSRACDPEHVKESFALELLFEVKQGSCFDFAPSECLPLLVG